MRVLLASILTLSAAALGGCSYQPNRVYTYTQSEGGSIAASDGVGSGMSKRATITTATVPESQR
jgi:hypothetical protein